MAGSGREALPSVTAEAAAGYSFHLRCGCCLITAAVFGYKDAVAHLYESGVELAGYYNQIARKAAANGHVDTIEYMYHNHMFEAAGYSAYGAAMQAAANGQLEVLKFLYDNGIEIVLNQNIVMMTTAEKGHLNTLQYLHEQQNFDLFVADNNIMRSAICGGQLDVIKYLQEQGVDFSGCKYAVAEAAARGHLDTIKYLYQNGVDITANNNAALQMAIARDHLDIVKYLHQNGADLSVLIELNGAIDNSYAMGEAVHKNYEDILKYLQNQGIYTDEFLVIDVINTFKKLDFPHLYAPPAIE